MLLKIIFGVSFLLLGIATVLFYIHLGGVSNFFIVRFDSLLGLTFVGSRIDVWGILLTGLVVNLTNAMLAWVLSGRDKFLTHLLPFFTLFFSLLILISVGVIITIN